MATTEVLTEAELERNLDNVQWRLANLYWIISKGDDDEGDGLVVKFVPNLAQRRLIARMAHRNLILKARQLGFTTLVSILWLDTALFSKSPIRCGIIAHEREAAEDIFRSKIVFAYERLDEGLREKMPVRKLTQTEIHFAHNGASIRVATSMRSGTTHRLHISELGKIAAKYPAKAREVVTGSLPSVPKSGVTIIESTAEGQDGVFYDLAQRAIAQAQAGSKLSVRDYKMHFFSWWMAPEYELDPSGVIFTPANLTYFTKVEAKIGRRLSERKRAWYVTTLRSECLDDAPLMWQEYPSYPEEAFAVSTEGCYYATQLAAARTTGRIMPRLPVEASAVNTFWDIGRRDLCALWMHQRVGPENRFIGYYEAAGEDFSHFARHLFDRGWTYGRHYLPHDAVHKRQGLTPDTNLSPVEMLEKLMPGHRFDVVPRVSLVLNGIQSTRNVFGSCWFDETACDQGLKRLAGYRKEWDNVRGCWRDNPLHDDNSNGADAFRQFGQVADGGEAFGWSVTRPAGAGDGWRKPGSGRRRHGTGMAA